MPKLPCAQLRLCSILRSPCVSSYNDFDMSEGSMSEGACSGITLQKHCQITFLRTFGSRRPPTAATPTPFSLGWPPPLLPLQPPSIASSSLDLLPPRSKDREEEEHVELKRKRGSRRCSTPSLLADFLGETLDKDKIHVPPCNYVFLEVVDHGD
jgi:hypothetical protein